MARKTDAAADLAEQMVRVLQSLSGQGGDAYPPTLRRLAELADPAASPGTVLAAVHPMRKAFSQHAVVARRDLGAPVALQVDVPRLLASPLLLEYLLETMRTPANHAASVADLKGKVTSRLQKPFQEAVNRQAQEESLPPTVGWVLIKGTRKLFLLRDLHAGRGARPAAPAAPVPEPAGAPPAPPPPSLQAAIPPPADLGPAFEAAFERLNRQAGSHNFVSLVELRRALPVPRDALDAQLRRLRLAGRYSLSAAEGRHGLRPEEHEAAILEDGALLLYVSRKSS